MGKLHLQTLTASELSSFRSCRQRWWLNYDQQLDPRREESYVRNLGNLYHGCVALGIKAIYRNWQSAPVTYEDSDHGYEVAIGQALKVLEKQQPTNGADVEAMTDWQSMGDKLLSMLQCYWEFMADRWEHQIPLYVEDTFRVPILNNGGKVGHLWLEGAWDVIWWDKRQQALFIEDHKTTSKSFSEIEKRLPLDVQMSSYVYGLKMTLRARLTRKQTELWPGYEALGITHAAIDAVGIVRYNVARTKAPTRPKTNKDGTISTAAIDTRPDMYRAALESQEGTPKPATAEKQQALLAKLEATPPEYFRQIEHHWSEREIERWRKEVWIDAADMRAVSRQPARATRNQFTCTEGPYGCSYEDGCLEPASIPDFYTRRENRHRELSPEVAL